MSTDPRHKLSETADLVRHEDGDVEFTIEVEAHGGDFVDATLRLTKLEQWELVKFLMRGGLL